MKSIVTNVESELVIDHSKFITKLFKISSEDNAKEILNNLKTEYKDATHICYAYIIENIKRFNDDKEPNGTAGLPILNVLENNNLNYILAVVIRYFGGIKLGAGGLVRAYSNSISEALKETEIKDLEVGFKMEIIFSYNNIEQINYLLKDVNIISKSFDNSVTYELVISKTKLLNIQEKLNSLIISQKIKEQLLLTT